MDKMFTREKKKVILDRIKKIPIVDTLKMKIKRLSHGYCETRVPRKVDYDGIFSSFHGGLLLTVADTTSCFAILTMTDPYADLATTDMNIRFLAPCLTDVTAKARVIKLGRTMCPVSVELIDDEGRKVAIAQVNYIILDKKPNRPLY
jgi:uncharacterized protein (TIGR00369 family)